MGEAIALAHVIKYAEDRLTGIDGISADHSAVLLECRRLESKACGIAIGWVVGSLEWMYLGGPSHAAIYRQLWFGGLVHGWSDREDHS